MFREKYVYLFSSNMHGIRRGIYIFGVSQFYSGNFCGIYGSNRKLSAVASGRNNTWNNSELIHWMTYGAMLGGWKKPEHQREKELEFWKYVSDFNQKK